MFHASLALCIPVHPLFFSSVVMSRSMDEKKKFKETLAGLSLLCDVVKDLVLEALGPAEPV